MFLEQKDIIKLADHTFKHWLKEMDKENEGYLSDLAKHGASGGFAGMTMYKETIELYDKYEKEIWEFLFDFAEGMGETVLGMLNESAERVKSSIDDSTSFKNFVVWFYAEVMAQQITEDDYNNPYER